MNLLTSLPLFLAQTTDDTLNSMPPPQQMNPVVGIVVLLITLVMIVSLWKVFTKAGEPGWASIVPIYNFYILFKIAGKPAWWLILLLVPFVNFVILILVYLGLAKNFGKGAGFGLGLIFLSFIFLPILAFGSARYMGHTGMSSLPGGTDPYPVV